MMIRAVMFALVRQRLHSPMRIVLAAACFGLGVMGVLFSGSIAGLDRTQLGGFGFLAAAGLIGQEVSSGVLTLAFARPIQRLEWVLGRWLGASLIGVSLVLLQVAVCVVVATLRHGAPEFSLIVMKLLDGTLAVFGVCAVLLLFSALAPGLGDLAILLLATITGGIFSAVGMQYRSAWISRTGAEIQRFVSPTLDPAPFFGTGALSWFAIASYLSTIALCVVLAVWVVNRKELSYASG